jgi:putative hemolysin
VRRPGASCSRLAPLGEAKPPACPGDPFSYIRRRSAGDAMQETQFSYADAGDPLVKRLAIRLVEAAVGQPRLKRVYLDILRHPVAGEGFFTAVVRGLRLDIHYDGSQLARIPRSGPLVVVANHAFGALDGIVLSRLIEDVRSDFLALTHSVLLRVPELRRTMLPVDFSGTPEATRTNLRTRAEARQHLAGGGTLIVFPSGTVATSPDRLGLRPAIEVPWQPFTSQLIQRSQATVVPVFFKGQNSWLFQVASHVSPTLRMVLLFREVKNRIGTTLPVVIGDPIPFSALAQITGRRALADHLRTLTYALAGHGEGHSAVSATATISGDALVGDPGASR